MNYQQSMIRSYPILVMLKSSIQCLYKDESLIKILVKLQALFPMQMDYGLLLFTTVKHHAARRLPHREVGIAA